MSSKSSPGLEATITLSLSLMIIVTIIGNILVCLSVVLVRKLRSPSNYLLVSLAISDLCVAILVMPLALNLEMKGYWDLGPTLCDMWVSFDVTSCTASILNLCMISIDRYLTITKPLTYGVKRTTKRMTAFIAIVWISSCLISVPPLLVLGNDTATTERPSCQVSQHIVYQLYATLGAFYIPLAVMIILYYKIYGAAKSVVDAELRSLGHTTERLVNYNNTNSRTPIPENHQQQRLANGNGNSNNSSSRYFSSLKPLLRSSYTNNSNNKSIEPSPPPPPIEPFKSLTITPTTRTNVNQSLSQQQSTPATTTTILTPVNKQLLDAPCVGTNGDHELDYQPSSSPAPSTPSLPNTPRNGLICCNQQQQLTDDNLSLPIKESLLSRSKTISIPLIEDNNNNTTTPITGSCDHNNSNNGYGKSNSNNNFHSTLLSSYQRVKETLSPRLRRSTYQSDSVHGSPEYYSTETQNKYHSCLLASSTSVNQSMLGTQQPQGNHSSIPSNPNGSSNFCSTHNSNITNHSTNHHLSTFAGVRKSLGDRLSFHAALHSTEKRRTSSMLKERKASITLGVIMTAFTACWLPFFILALLRPFSVTVNQIPHWISSLCYWLGLANSMLNPIIYVTFHHDFRQAFRYLLCLQCSTMDFRLRERAYQSQYGINNSSENRLHHLPNTNTTTTHYSTHLQSYTHSVTSLPPQTQPQPQAQQQFSPALPPVPQQSPTKDASPAAVTMSTTPPPSSTPTQPQQSLPSAPSIPFKYRADENRTLISPKENFLLLPTCFSSSPSPIAHQSHSSTIIPLTDDRLPSSSSSSSTTTSPSPPTSAPTPATSQQNLFTSKHTPL